MHRATTDSVLARLLYIVAWRFVPIVPKRGQCFSGGPYMWLIPKWIVCVTSRTTTQHFFLSCSVDSLETQLVASPVYTRMEHVIISTLHIICRCSVWCMFVRDHLRTRLHYSHDMNTFYLCSCSANQYITLRDCFTWTFNSLWPVDIT